MSDNFANRDDDPNDGSTLDSYASTESAVLEPDEGVVGIGSGGPYALAAAKALARHTDLDARAIAEHAMSVAASICIYTNGSITVEEMECAT